MVYYKFLCVIQPAVGRLEDYRRFRDLVASGFSRNQVRFLDLEEMEQITDDMFPDGMHTNAAGHRMMAEIVAKRTFESACSLLTAYKKRVLVKRQRLLPVHSPNLFNIHQ
jgi:hypothetical protein